MLANLLLFRSTAPNVLRVVDFEEDNKSPYKVVAKQIVRQCLQRTMYQQEYLQYKDRQRLAKGRNKLNVADTVVKSWTTISQRCLFGILSRMVTNKPTSLQIALGIRVRQKNRVKSLPDFGVIFSYDKMLQCTASAASAVAM